ncbi:ABC transporter substrate-binding protein [Nonomuraea turkmeniaca]|uniref:ABC transporter substrate-binding protein n=1 Tax=Nonomuraea turkmeniaca TaxID=103838 RepID=A0A5S4FAV4_9ACTN|nr:ABC transporter substrate-binding protein [Nonomuraea turkmeniaca]TMR14369.1 ABC transporter substrate-binding protein [Nonomuraea turkmeniaca]
MYRQSRMFIAIAAALWLALAGCGAGTEPPQGSKTAAAAKSVTIAISSDEGTLTPFTNQTGYPGNNLVKLIFDTLVIVQGDGVTPLLARQIQTTDNKVFTMPLRQGVTWHDGKPLTADDVVFSVEFYKKNMEGDSSIDVRPVESVTGSGDTVTLTLKAPDPEFPRRILADMAILPKHLWESVEKVSEAGTDKAVGTGPYKLTQYDNARGYTLTANASYAMGQPKVDTVKVVVIPEESTQFAALRTGEIQLSTRIVPPQQLQALERQPNIGVVKGTEFASTLLAFNTTRAPFDKPEVRRALAKAIDVSDLVKTALLGQGTPGNPGFIHAESPVKPDSLAPVYDVEAAKQELDGLGAKPGADGIRVLDGKPMSYELLVQSTSTDRLRSAELIRDMLKAVGVAVKVSSLDPDSLDAKVWPDYDVRKGRNYDMSMWGWSAPVMLSSGSIAQLVASDPEDGSLNIVGFKDDQVDATVKTLTSAPSMEDRTAAAKQLQAQIAEQMPFLTLYYRNGAYAFRKDVFSGWTWQNGSAVLNKFSVVDFKLQ